MGDCRGLSFGIEMDRQSLTLGSNCCRMLVALRETQVRLTTEPV
jgi:hypothetical protein